jgi:hypothetical protein
MINKIQYTMLTVLAVTMLISLGISNVSVSAATAINPQTLQEIQGHLTEAQTALDNNDVEGAKMHLNFAMEQLTELQGKVAGLESSPGMAGNTTSIR